MSTEHSALGPGGSWTADDKTEADRRRARWPAGQAGSVPQGSGAWRARLPRLVLASDLAVAVAVSSIAVAVKWNAPTQGWSLERGLVLGALSVSLLMLMFALLRCWDGAVLGVGIEEFNRVLKALAAAGLVLAVVGLAIKSDAARPLVFGVIPVTGAGILVERYAIRKILHRARRRSRYMLSVLVVGPEAAIADLAFRTRRVPQHGWTVVAACTSSGVEGGLDVPVVGDLDDVATQARALQVEVVAVAPGAGVTASRLRRLAWDLESCKVDLVVDPGLMEIGGPRLHVAPVDGLPLLRLTEPRFTGPARVAKNVADRVAAATLLVILAPVLIMIAIAVAWDGGSMIFRQTRVGREGRPFTIYKFRSMHEGNAVPRGSHDGAGPVFKLRQDPRVTRVGAFLRRYSLDEFPQLVNVLRGSMSLVGPRPPLPEEVETYAPESLRKLMVRPGMTGMWQVNGRSDLSWDESVRLDLRYVENWSPALDAQILWKTVWAVVRGRGAY